MRRNTYKFRTLTLKLVSQRDETIANTSEKHI